MTSTTDPTVPLPTATDSDDDDDDDDDVSSSLLASQPPAATPPPAQSTVAPAPASPPAETAVPGISSAPADPATTAVPAPASPSGSPSISGSIPPSSATEPAGGLPSSSATALNPTTGGGNGLSSGASAGIGVGVALVVCLAAFGVWFFMRRRKPHRTQTRLNSIHSSDEERAPQAQKLEVYAYRSGGLAEVSGDEKPRRWSELESPTSIAEADDGQVLRAELPGSAVPVNWARKGTNERLFADAPIDEVDEPVDPQERTIEKKRDERLFSDAPIDEGTLDSLANDPSSRRIEKKW